MNPKTPSRRRLLLAGVLGTLLLGGCAGQQLDAYQQEKPALDLAQYFNGELQAHGMFQNWRGQVVRRFTVDMTGRWNGDEGVLDERFHYADGEQGRRVWHLRRHADGRYTGTADDVVGQAEGRVVGNAFYWEYTLRLPVEGRVYEVQFNDWMYLVNDQVMLNRATLSKFGVPLGEVTLSFYKAQ
jgi:hypothetical protein